VLTIIEGQMIPTAEAVFGGLVVRDARRRRAPHHEDQRPHPEEHRTAMRLEG
jgi:hypothetical protein